MTAAAILGGMFGWYGLLVPLPEFRAVEGLEEPELVFGATGLSSGLQPGDRVTVEVQVWDGAGRMLADSETRGVPVTVEIGSPDNDPWIEEAVRDLAEGAWTISRRTPQAAYRSRFPVGLLPEDGWLTLRAVVLQVQRAERR